MPFLEDTSFDAVVANYVLMDVRDYEAAIAEIARVLRPGGRFVCVNARSSFEGRWHTPALDSPRREDRKGWLDDNYFVRQAGYMCWGDLKPLLTFYRPLRDYVAACKRVGLALCDLDEPEMSDEARRDWPTPFDPPPYPRRLVLCPQVREGLAQLPVDPSPGHLDDVTQPPGRL